MPSRILIALCLCLASTSALAQSPESRIEISGGYSNFNGSFRHRVQDSPGESTGLGWNAAVVLFASDDVDFTAEIAGHSGTQNLGQRIGVVDASLYRFLAGAKFAEPIGRTEISIRLLGGVARSTPRATTGQESDTSVAVALGVGFDVPLGRFGIRVIQADILFSPVLESAARLLSVGAFYRF